jgi:uncharacterized protein YqhQ
MIVSMIVFLFVRTDNIWLRLGSRIILLPLIAGLSYEISVKWAARRNNWLVRAITFPGMSLQKLTTAEPDDMQIETAVVALNTVLIKEGLKLPVDTETDETDTAPDGTEGKTQQNEEI